MIRYWMQLRVVSREIPDEMGVGGKNKEQIKCTFFLPEQLES